MGQLQTQSCRQYGTKSVGGVTPGKGGETLDSVPVFDTVAEAVKATEADASMVFVPPAFTADAIAEAVDAGVIRYQADASGREQSVVVLGQHIDTGEYRIGAWFRSGNVRADNQQTAKQITSHHDTIQS